MSGNGKDSSPAPVPQGHERTQSSHRLELGHALAPPGGKERSGSKDRGRSRVRGGDHGRSDSAASHRSAAGTGSPSTNNRKKKAIGFLDTNVIPGSDALVRSLEGKQVDFWNSVTNMDAVNLETILALAKTEQVYSVGAFIDGISYQGFDRLLYIKTALRKISVKHFCQFALVGAIRGSNFSKIVEKSDHVPQDLITAFGSAQFVKKPKKKTDLTILRCTASIPHWCAYWMQKHHVAKKIETQGCPAALQFPGAASLPMSKAVRIQHIEFCQAFSSLLPGGTFNVNIYLAAYGNLIPLGDVPLELRPVLDVGSDAEARALSSKQILEDYGKAVVKA